MDNELYNVPIYAGHVCISGIERWDCDAVGISLHHCGNRTGNREISKISVSFPRTCWNHVVGNGILHSYLPYSNRGPVDHSQGLLQKRWRSTTVARREFKRHYDNNYDHVPSCYTVNTWVVIFQDTGSVIENKRRTQRIPENI